MDLSLGPIHGALFSSPTWFYIDSSSYERGPFRPDEMWAWYREGYFPPNLVVRPNKRSIFTRMAELQIGNAVQPRGKREWEKENDSVERDSKIIKKEELVSFQNSKQELQERIDPKEEYIKPEIQDERDSKIIKKEELISFPNSKQELQETIDTKEEYIEAEIKNEKESKIIKKEEQVAFPNSKQELKEKIDVKEEYIETEIKDERDTKIIKKEEFVSFSNTKQVLQVTMDAKEEYIESDTKIFKDDFGERQDFKDDKLYKDEYTKAEIKDERYGDIGSLKKSAQEFKEEISGKVEIKRELKKASIKLEMHSEIIKKEEFQSLTDIKQELKMEMSGKIEIKNEYIEPEVKCDGLNTLKGDLSTITRQVQPCKSANYQDRKKENNQKKIFVGGLKYTTTEETLRSHFSQYGKLVDVVVMKFPDTKRSRGFGFVTYAEQDHVDACQDARPHVLDGKQVETKRATPRIEMAKTSGGAVKKVFVGGFKDDVEDSQLDEYFGQFGHVVSVTRMTEKKTGKKRGFGFVEFDDYDTVDKIILKGYHEINGRKVDVKKAISKEDMEAANQRKGGGGGQHGGWEGQQRGWGQDQGYGAEGGYGGQGGYSGGRWKQGSCGGGGGSLYEMSTPQAMSGKNHGMENLLEISAGLPSHLPSSKFPLDKTPHLLSSTPLHGQLIDTTPPQFRIKERGSEEDKINEMMKHSTEMYDQKHWKKYWGRSAFPSGAAVPLYWKCSRCQGNHWINDCPHPHKIKKTTGFPRSFFSNSDISVPISVNPQSR